MTRLIFLIFLLVIQSHSEFEVCTPGEKNSVYRFTKDKCPAGVLFEEPVTVRCLESTENTLYFFKDLCSPEDFMADIQSSGTKIHFVFELEEDELDEQSTCFGNATNRCLVDPASQDSLIDASLSTMTPPDWLGCEDDDDYFFEEPEAAEEVARHADPQVYNQTERLFHFMLGARKDFRERPAGQLRVVQILKQCFNILEKFCDKRFVPADFGRDVLKAFLFLLRDSDMHNFQDVSHADFLVVKKSLDECEQLDVPQFRLKGRICPTCPMVRTIEKKHHSRRYTSDEFSFVKGKYDIAVDATWGAITFVHGLCFGNYKSQQNYLHYFQREMERLFTPEIMHRWSRPPKLFFEDMWDHIFSAKAKTTMRNLDSCIQAAYLQTPFLHRLERPLTGHVSNALPNTKSTASSNTSTPTSVPSSTLSKPKRILEGSNGLKGAGWCFQTTEDRMQTTEAYVNLYCPNKRNALREVQRMDKESNADTSENSVDSNDGTTEEPEEFDVVDEAEPERF